VTFYSLCLAIYLIILKLKELEGLRASIAVILPLLWSDSFSRSTRIFELPVVIIALKASKYIAVSKAFEVVIILLSTCNRLAFTAVFLR